MKPICGTASECTQSQVIMWLCAWHIGSRLQGLQQNGVTVKCQHFRCRIHPNRIKTLSFSSLVLRGCQPSMHSCCETLRDLHTTTKRRHLGMFTRSVNVLHDITHPHLPALYRTCCSKWTEGVELSSSEPRPVTMWLAGAWPPKESGKGSEILVGHRSQSQGGAVVPAAAWKEFSEERIPWLVCQCDACINAHGDYF